MADDRANTTNLLGRICSCRRRTEFLDLRSYCISEDGIPEAEQAVRDILFLYRGAVAECRGFGHNLETGTFDAFKFLTCTVDEPKGYSFGFDLQLLHEGSAVALLCHLSDYVDDCGPEGIEYIRRNYSKLAASSEASFPVVTARIWKGLHDGLFSDLPIAQDAASMAFDDEQAFRDKLVQVYREYVVGYFRRLLSEA